MEKSEYTNILKSTLRYNYPQYLNKNIIKELEKRGFIKNKVKNSEVNAQTNFIEDKFINLSKLEYEEKINKIFDVDNFQTEKTIEKLEFEREYSYGLFLKITKKNKSCKDIINYNPNDVENKHDVYIYKKNDRVYIKNNIYLTSNDGIKIKYPIINVIHKVNNDEILEIRLSKVAIQFQNKEDFYRESIKENLKTLGFECSGICFKNTIKNLDNFEFNDDISIENFNPVKIIIKDMRLSSGAKAKLDADSSPNQLIPILGDLEELIRENIDLFEKNEETHKIKSILNEFIENINKTSDIPSVGIIFSIKNIEHQVYITHNYKGTDYSMFNFRYPLCSDEERMNYVREIFIGNYRET